jgi:hypothetical protein
MQSERLNATEYGVGLHAILSPEAGCLMVPTIGNA